MTYSDIKKLGTRDLSYVTSVLNKRLNSFFKRKGIKKHYTLKDYGGNIYLNAARAVRMLEKRGLSTDVNLEKRHKVKVSKEKKQNIQTVSPINRTESIEEKRERFSKKNKHLEEQERVNSFNSKNKDILEKDPREMTRDEMSKTIDILTEEANRRIQYIKENDIPYYEEQTEWDVLNKKDDMRAMRMNIRRLQDFLQHKNSNANDLENRYIDTVNTLAGKNNDIFEALQDNSDLISRFFTIFHRLKKESANLLHSLNYTSKENEDNVLVENMMSIFDSHQDLTNEQIQTLMYNKLTQVNEAGGKWE